MAVSVPYRSTLDVHSITDAPPEQTIEPTIKKTIQTLLETERNMKIPFYCAMVGVLSSALFGKFIPNVTIYHVSSYLLLCLLMVFDIYTILVISSFTHLHYMRIKRKTLTNARFLFVPYGIEEKYDRPMSSISMLVGLRGSNVERMFGLISYSTFFIIFYVVMLKSNEALSMRTIDIELILLLISVFGTMSAPLWELVLDKHSKFSNIMHYFAVALEGGTAPVAFMLNQKYSALSLVLSCVCYITLLLWLFLMMHVQQQTYDKDNEEAIHRVNINSKMVLLLELLCMSLMYFIYILFVFCMSADRILGVPIIV